MSVFFRLLVCCAGLAVGLSGCHKEGPTPAPPTPPPVTPPSPPVTPPTPPPPVPISPSPWIRQVNTSPARGFFALRFATDRSGWLLGGADEKSEDGFFMTLHTKDGGASWIKMDLAPLHLSRSFFDLCAVTDQIVYAVGDDLTVSGSTFSRFVYKSTNGGQTWRQLPNQGFQGGYLTFLNEQVGFAIESGGISKTTDGGQTWGLVCEGRNALGDPSLTMVTPLVGYAKGGVFFDGINAGTLLKTTDGGETWQNLHWTHEAINHLTFLTPQVGLLTTGSMRGSGSTRRFVQSLYKTVDGGVTWQLFSDDTPGGGYVFVSEQEFYSFKLGIQHTRDGGASWVLEYALPMQLYQDRFRAMTILPDGTLYAVSDQGVMVKRAK